MTKLIELPPQILPCYRIYSLATCQGAPSRRPAQSRKPGHHFPTTRFDPHGSSHGAAQPQPRAVHDPTGATPSATKALGPTLRANPCPEVTDPFCRLPLPTLSHWPEAFHLGDLMRL